MSSQVRLYTNNLGYIFLYRFPKWAEFQSFQDGRAWLGCEQFITIVVKCPDGILVRNTFYGMDQFKGSGISDKFGQSKSLNLFLFSLILQDKATLGGQRLSLSLIRLLTSHFSKHATKEPLVPRVKMKCYDSVR